MYDEVDRGAGELATQERKVRRAGQPEGGVEAADTGPKGVPQAVLGTEGKLLEARTARRYNEVDRGARRLATQERRVLHPLQKLLD